MQSDDHLTDREREETLADFVKAYREELDPQLPEIAGARAMLRGRLENARAVQKAWPLWRWSSLGASLAAACLVVIAVYHQGAAERSIPKNALTPGEARMVSLEQVCRGSAVESVDVPVEVRQRVFREYGIHDSRSHAYEVDYLITPDLGGTASIRNLWPQPYSVVWNAHVKDELEDRLHGLVCSGQLDLTTAQREMARDWIAAYKKYFHTDRPE